MEWRDLSTRGRNDMARAWVIARKDMRIYYLKPPVILFGVLMPVFLFLAFMIRRNLDATALIPGVMAMTIFFSSSTVTSAAIPWERMSRTYDRLLTAPVSLFAVLWGKAMAGIVFGVLVSMVPLLIGVLAFDMPVGQPWLLVLTVLISACAFASLGVLLASVPTPSVGNIMMLGNMIRLPLIFVSGIFIPLAELPDWGRAIAFLSPLTYCNDLLSHSIAGTSYLLTPVSLVVLLVFWVAFLLVGAKLHGLSKKA
ncbi:MAG: ABC transporter permease [Dehalococcoidia bacterium]